MATRPVKYYKHEWKGTPPSQYQKLFIGVAEFHQFGVGYEEFENGPGNYSTAIIELEDGTVKNINADLIVFTDK